MSKRIALIGHCGADSSYLRIIVSRAAGPGASVVAADDDSELKKVIEDGIDLLLLNRELGYGFKEELGVDLIKRLRVEKPDVKTMLVSNYAEAQAAAVANGALPGFGKREIGTPRVVQVLKEALA
jgi:two-component system chemotaxis response regulator CheY